MKIDAPKAFSKDTDEQTAKWIREALEHPGSFGLSSEHEHYDDMFKTWSLGPVIETRDSDTLEKSNARALREYLAKDRTLKRDWCETECNHWAVGWVTHLSFRVIDRRGNPTRIARVLREWFDSLSDYPIADESLYSEMEREACEENWSSWQAREVRRYLVKELESRVECTTACLDSNSEECTCDQDDRVARTEDQVDAVPDETFWEIAVRDEGNGREIEGDCYQIGEREISEIADTLIKKGLVIL